MNTVSVGPAEPALAPKVVRRKRSGHAGRVHSRKALLAEGRPLADLWRLQGRYPRWGGTEAFPTFIIALRKLAEKLNFPATEQIYLGQRWPPGYPYRSASVRYVR